MLWVGTDFIMVKVCYVKPRQIYQVLSGNLDSRNLTQWLTYHKISVDVRTSI